MDRARFPRILIALIATLAVVVGCSPQPLDGEATLPTYSGIYTITATPKLDPLVINRIHEWTLHIEAADGDPVENARIMVEGDMPEHQHGLPTQPEVTENLGNGDYLVEGMKFSMPGDWEVTFTVTADDGSDAVTFDLVLP
jgi:hypothetical protein